MEFNNNTQSRESIRELNNQPNKQNKPPKVGGEKPKDPSVFMSSKTGDNYNTSNEEDKDKKKELVFDNKEKPSQEPSSDRTSKNKKEAQKPENNNTNLTLPTDGKENILKKTMKTFLQKLDPILNFIYTISFLIVVIIQLNSNQEYYVMKKVKTSLGMDFHHLELNDFSQIYTYTDQLVYNASLSNFVIGEKFPLVSNVRANMKRYRQTERDHRLIIGLKYSSHRENIDITPFDTFNYEKEDDGVLNNAFTYINDTTFLKKGAYVMELSKSELERFDGKGDETKSYEDFLKKPDQFGQEFLDYIKNFNLRFKNSFFLQQSNPATLTFDFALINYEVWRIIPVYITYTISSSGLIKFESEVYTIPIDLYSSRTDHFRLFWEIILAVTVLFYFIYFIKRLAQETKRVYETEERKIKKKAIEELYNKEKKEKNINKIKEKEEKEELKNRIKNQIRDQVSKTKRRKTGMVKPQSTLVSKKKTAVIPQNILQEEMRKKDTLEMRQLAEDKNMQELIDARVEEMIEPTYVIAFRLAVFNYTFQMISVVLSLLVVIYWIVVISKHVSFWKDLADPYELMKVANLLTSDKMNDLHNLAFTLSHYRIIVCINFLFLFLGLLRLFGEAVKKSIIISTCLNSASMDILSFLILYITYCLAVSLLCFFYYQEVEPFHEFQTTLQTIVSFSATNVSDVYLEMWNENSSLTLIVMIFTVVFIKLTLIKIVLAIIIYWYAFACNLWETQNNAVNLKSKTIEELFKLPRQMVYELVKLVLSVVSGLIDFVTCANNAKDKVNVSFKPKSQLRSLIAHRRILQGLRNNVELDNIPSRNTYNRDAYDKDFDSSDDEESQILKTVDSKEHENKQVEFKEVVNFKSSSERDKANPEKRDKGNKLTKKGDDYIENQFNSEDPFQKNAVVDENMDSNRDSIKEREAEEKKRLESQHQENEILEKRRDDLIIDDKEEQQQSSKDEEENKKHTTTKNKKKSSGRVIDVDEEDILLVVPNDIVETDIHMKEGALVGKRNVYFDSERDKHLIVKYNERKYRFKIVDLMVFIFFFISLIISAFMSNYVPHKSLLYSSIIAHFENHPVEQERRLSSVNTLSHIKTFLFETMPKEMLTLNKEMNNFDLLNSNMLMRGGMILTVKKNIERNEEMTQAFKSRAMNETLRKKINRNENRTSVRLDEDLMVPYLHEKSFQDLGGYVVLINLYDYYSETDAGYNAIKDLIFNQTGLDFDGKRGFLLSEKQQTGIIDDYTTYVFLESYYLNLEFSVGTRLVVKFKVTAGGYIEKQIEPHFLRLETFNTLSIINYVFDVLFLFSFASLSVLFVLKQQKRYYAYKQWEKENIKTLSIKTQEVRNHINPEVLRRFFYILNGDFIVNMLIFVLGVLYTIFRVVNIIDAIELKNSFDLQELKTYQTTAWDFQHIFNTKIADQDGLSINASLLLILMSCRLLFSIDFGKYFGVITGTINEASGLLFIFLVILLLTQPAFICFSYIGFGYNLPYFNTWISSALYTLIEMFGDYPFLDVTHTQESIGPLHFYLYVIIINIILLNVFISALDRAYLVVKERIKNLAEEFSYPYIFCFCCYRRKHIYDQKASKLDNNYDPSKIIQKIDYSMIPPKELNFNPKEFSQIEVAKSIQISDELTEKINEWLLFESAYLSIAAGIESDILITSSYFKSIKAKHYHTSGMVISDYVSKVITLLDYQILGIENCYDHISQFRKFKNYRIRTNGLYKKNEEAMVDINHFENLIKKNLKELERYQKIELRLEDIDVKVQDEFLNAFNQVNEEASDSVNLSVRESYIRQRELMEEEDSNRDSERRDLRPTENFNLDFYDKEDREKDVSDEEGDRVGHLRSNNEDLINIANNNVNNNANTDNAFTNMASTKVETEFRPNMRRNKKDD
eukprot:CAMPEP_0170519972 /NCGR_PEP_ID=MMETSP0209-20121228/5185_1 /TAXON_ID=665100 ORGANISM="Litonotus pictus, Strain P1" /NCGR_SAMPLE_ID=MMETSP0209 /ASSEMBLY_ACC=CAM_ASM_000301 /LENGTH=1889 /DNA_ID=CAMNT_0010805983 /DNA_START=1 /DNA_END=5670 /DNA_ORIENTATION=+